MNFFVFGRSLGHPNHLGFIRVELSFSRKYWLTYSYVYEKVRFPFLFSLVKIKCFFFLTGKTIPESIRGLPLNKNTEFNQNMFSNKLDAISVYKFIMTIKLPIR